MLPFNGENKLSQSILDAASKILDETPKPTDFWDGITDVDNSKEFGLGAYGQIQHERNLTEDIITEDKIDDIIEKIFSGKAGSELTDAWTDGDKKKAIKILKKEKIKGGDIKGVVKRLFGEEYQSLLGDLSENISVDGRTKGFRAALKRIESHRARLSASASKLTETEDEDEDIYEAFDKNLEQNLKNDTKKLRVWDMKTNKILITGTSMEVLKKRMKLSNSEIKDAFGDIINYGGYTTDFKGSRVNIEVNESRFVKEASMSGDANTTDLNPLVNSYEDGIMVGHLNLATFMSIHLMNARDQKSLASAVLKSGERKQLPVSDKMLKDWNTAYKKEGTKAPKITISVSQHHKQALTKLNEENVLDISRLNSHIKVLAKSIDEGKDVDFLSRGRVLNALSQAGIVWDHSLLERKHLEVLGINEAKTYAIYHKSFTSAVDEVIRFLANKGYHMSDEDIWDNISTGPRKPSKGKTNKYSIPLFKHDKETRKTVQFQVYGMDGKGPENYELNMYIG